MNLMKMMQNHRIKSIDYNSVFASQFQLTAKQNGYMLNSIDFNCSGVVISGFINLEIICDNYNIIIPDRFMMPVYFENNIINKKYIFDNSDIPDELVNILDINLKSLIFNFNDEIKLYKYNIIDEDKIISDLHDAGFL